MHSSLDLNLLRAFVFVYRTQNLTRAAEKLRLSQPAVSHSLKRLRQHFGDPLFIRSRTGVRPTQQATHIYEEINGPLSQILNFAEERSQFNPATSTRRFRIALTDLGEAALLPRILQEISRVSPGIRVDTVPLDISTVTRDLLSHDIDAAIASSPVHGAVKQEVLFHDHYGCLVPRELPDEGGRIRVEDLRNLREARVSASAGHRTLSELFASTGEGAIFDVPHVEVHSFTSLPKLVARCGFFAIVPVSAFSDLTNANDTKILELPFPSPLTPVLLMTDQRQAGSSALRWFIAALRDALTRESSPVTGLPSDAAVR